MTKVFKINIVVEVSADNILAFEQALDPFLEHFGKKLAYKYLPNTDYLKDNKRFKDLKKFKRQAGWNVDTFFNENPDPDDVQP